MSRRARETIVLAAMLGVMACFEEPVRDHLHLHLVRDGTVAVVLVQEVEGPGVARGNPALARRLEDTRDAIEGGWDPWSQRLDRLTAVAERRLVERHLGTVRRSVRSVLLGDPRDLEPFLGESGLAASLVGERPSRELVLEPVRGTQATAVQRRRAEASLTRFAGAVAHYLGVAGRLWDHLDSRPERAAACFVHLLGEADDETPVLTEDEAGIVEALSEAMQDVAAVLAVPSNEAMSPNQLIRLAYDPFPSRLTLTADGRVTLHRGWLDEGGLLERPPVSAWQALLSLTGRWLQPDLVTVAVAPGGLQPEPDPAALAAAPRWHSPPPSDNEVETALRAALAPEPLHLLRWTPAPGPPPDPRSALVTAEEHAR